MQTRPSSITGSWTRALRTSKSLSLQRHSGEECGRYWIHCRRHRGAVARILVMDDDGMLRGAIRIALEAARYEVLEAADRKSTRLNSSHGYISYAVFCLKKKKNRDQNVHIHPQSRRRR